MSLENLEKAFQLMEDCFSEDEKHMGQGCSLDTIHYAESFLDIEFPTTYKELLKRYGYIDFGGLEIYGLIKEEDFKNQEIPFYATPNVVWTVLKYHQQFNHPLHLLILYHLGEGTKYCLDLSQMRDDECPVVVWPISGYEHNPKLEIIAQDFGDFLLDMVNDEIKYRQEEAEE